jgi:hypothetical protein
MLQKYIDRPSPSVSATRYHNTVMAGNDGELWISKPNIDGVYRWVRVVNQIKRSMFLRKRSKRSKKSMKRSKRSKKSMKRSKRSKKSMKRSKKSMKRSKKSMKKSMKRSKRSKNSIKKSILRILSRSKAF